MRAKIPALQLGLFILRSAMSPGFVWCETGAHGSGRYTEAYGTTLEDYDAAGLYMCGMRGIVRLANG